MSVDLITVTYFDGMSAELREVKITLSSTLASPGNMTIRKEHANGGTFDAEFVLRPYFTFTRVSDRMVLTFDGAVRVAL